MDENCKIGSDTVPLLKYNSDDLSRQEKHALQHDNRVIEIGKPQRFFVNNAISTTKYNRYNFMCKNLSEQFSKAANLYFLILAILQAIKPVSITNGIPFILLPLTIIVLLTMVKDVFEDYKRYKSDEEENKKPATVWRDNKWIDINWEDIQVGDLCKVLKDEFFPCDLILLASADYSKGQCFIETKNLDGETNLKSKQVVDEVKSKAKDMDSTLALKETMVFAEAPNVVLSRFKGSIMVSGEKVPLSFHNFLLRGCILRNTDFIIGTSVYTG